MSLKGATCTTLIGLLAASTLTLTACGEDDTAGSETGTDVEDIQEDDIVEEAHDGAYDTAFYD